MYQCQNLFKPLGFSIIVLNLALHSMAMGSEAIICTELFVSTNKPTGLQSIKKDLSLIQQPSAAAQRSLELIQSIHDYRTALTKQPLPLHQMNLLNENLKSLKKKFETLGDYKNSSDPDGGIPAIILADSNLALFLTEQIIENSALKTVSRQILHSILSLGVIHFLDDHTYTAFYAALRNNYNESSPGKRDVIFDSSEPIIFYDGVFAGDLKNIGGDHADQIQMLLSFLNRLVSRKALSYAAARSIFEKEILNINPLPLSNSERLALVQSLKIKDRQVNVNAILELAGFKLVETDFLEVVDEAYPKSAFHSRTQYILKLDSDPSVHIVFFDDSVILPEEIANNKPTTYEISGIERIEAFFKKKSNTTMEIRALTVHGMPN